MSTTISIFIHGDELLPLEDVRYILFRNFVTSNNSSRKHLFEIWNMLQGEIYQEVSALSVMKIVYAIMGCHNVSLVNKCLE